MSGSHANPLAVKTDAPPSVVWDVVRCWVRQHPVRDPDPSSYAARLLAKEPKLEADFARAPGAVPRSQAAGITRFVQNPAFWGPKSRHGKALSEAQARQYKAHEAAAGAGGGGRGGAASGSGSAASGGRQQAAEEELDALYGGDGNGAAADAPAAAANGSGGGAAAAAEEAASVEEQRELEPAGKRQRV